MTSQNDNISLETPTHKLVECLVSTGSKFYQEKKKYEEAEIEFLKVLEFNHGHSLTLRYMGLIMRNHRKDYEKAEFYFKKTLESTNAAKSLRSLALLMQKSE